MKYLFINLGLVLSVNLFLFGCIKNKTERNVVFNIDEAELNVLNSQCMEMESHGDIMVLFKDISRHTSSILKALENPTSKSQQLIHALAIQINNKSKLVSELSKTEWTTEKWDHEVVWRIDEADFKKTFGTHFQGGFEILNSSIKDVYFMGEQRDDLKDRLEIVKEGNLVLIKYKSKASSLEICQLEKTLIIVSEIKFRNIRQIQTHYFTLYLEQ
jgi:hypothetical protein